MPTFWGKKKKKTPSTGASPQNAGEVVEVKSPKSPKSGNAEAERLPIASVARKKRKSDEMTAGESKLEEIQNKKQFNLTNMKLQFILDELDLEVNTRMQKMQTTADGLALALRNSLQIELIKLPARIRNMKMREFCSSDAVSTTAKKDVSRVLRTFEGAAATPLTSSREMQAAGTSVSSQQEKIPSASAVMDKINNIKVDIDGTTIDLSMSSPNKAAAKVNTLSTKNREAALQQLAILQQQMDNLMRSIK